MSETAVVTDKPRFGGRFVKGGIAGPGRPKGARSKFSEAFIQDLASTWETHGIEALEACAIKDPGTFLKVCASLMPRDINLNVGVSASDFAEKFRSAQALLGNDTPMRRSRLIEHDDAG